MATPLSRSPRLVARPHNGPNRPISPGVCRSKRALDAGNVVGARAQAWRRRLVVMVKAPAAGRVKTRLACEIGLVSATAFYRHASAALIARLARDPRWQTLLAVSPDPELRTPHWPRCVPRIRQGGGDLGARMQRVFDRVPPGPVLIIGSDCPAVRPADIAVAFNALGDADAVFGPAVDGGYWLVGERRIPRVLPAFTRVRWSSETALADTLSNFRGHRVATVCERADVDTAADFVRENARAARRVRS